MRNALRFLLAVLIFFAGFFFMTVVDVYIFEITVATAYIVGGLFSGLFCMLVEPKCPCERCKKKEKKDE